MMPYDRIVLQNRQTKGDPVTVAQRIYEVLRNRVLSGQLLPGARLVEADLTAEFQASRVTVREALRRLVADDLLELLPHRGIRVRLLSPRDIDELYVVRAPIEGLAARLAAEKAQPNLDGLRECCRLGEQAIADGDARRFMGANAQFHNALLNVTDNAILRKVATKLNAQMLSFQALRNMNLHRMRESHSGHLEILQAIEDRDPDRAEDAMRRHIAGAAASFRPVTSLDTQEAPQSATEEDVTTTD
jgi:DNA-binding GntR family transcriptional regulator